MGNRSRKAPKMGKRNIVARRTPAEYEAAFVARQESERAALAEQRENLERYAKEREAAAAKGAT